MALSYAPQFTARVVADIRIQIGPEYSLSFHAVGAEYEDLIADAKLWIGRHIKRNRRGLKGPFQAHLCCAIGGDEICLKPSGRNLSELINDSRRLLDEIIRRLYILPKQPRTHGNSTQSGKHPWYYALIRWSHLPKVRNRRHR